MGPFTVHNYSLSVVNSSSHSLIISRNITTRNVTAYTELFSIPHAGQACSELEIKLTATNVIGESGVGTTTGGFPVSKLLSFNSWLPSLYVQLACGERIYHPIIPLIGCLLILDMQSQMQIRYFSQKFTAMYTAMITLKYDW